MEKLCLELAEETAGARGSLSASLGGDVDALSQTRSVRERHSWPSLAGLQLPLVLSTAQLVPKQPVMLNPGLTAARSQSLPQNIDLSRQRKGRRAPKAKLQLSLPLLVTQDRQSHLMCSSQCLRIVIHQKCQGDGYGDQGQWFHLQMRGRVDPGSAMLSGC